MANHSFHVGSITNAMRGKHLLEEQGIRVYLRREAQPSANDGCGYSLLITGDVQKAEKILRYRGVRINRITEAM